MDFISGQVSALGGWLGDFEGCAVHFVAVEEDVGGVGAVVVEVEVVEVDDEGGGGFEAVDRVHEVDDPLDRGDLGSIGVHDDDTSLLLTDLGLVGPEAGDDAEARMADGETWGVDLVEADADGDDLGGAVGVVADEGEVELHGEARQIRCGRSVATRYRPPLQRNRPR